MVAPTSGGRAAEQRAEQDAAATVRISAARQRQRDHHDIERDIGRHRRDPVPRDEARRSRRDGGPASRTRSAGASPIAMTTIDSTTITASGSQPRERPSAPAVGGRAVRDDHRSRNGDRRSLARSAGRRCIEAIVRSADRLYMTAVPSAALAAPSHCHVTRLCRRVHGLARRTARSH